ncbi:hypothetical protein D3C77_255860 [compost metagenome]
MDAHADYPGDGSGSGCARRRRILLFVTYRECGHAASGRSGIPIDAGEYIWCKAS